MKRLIACLVLLGLLSACGDNSKKPDYKADFPANSKSKTVNVVIVHGKFDSLVPYGTNGYYSIVVRPKRDGEVYELKTVITMNPRYINDPQCYSVWKIQEAE